MAEYDPILHCEHGPHKQLKVYGKKKHFLTSTGKILLIGVSIYIAHGTIGRDLAR